MSSSPTPAPSHDDLVTPVSTTLERYIMRKQSEFPFATGELSQLLRDSALASKIMVREVSRAGLSGLAEVVAPAGQDTPPRHRLGEEAHVRFVRALTNGRELLRYPERSQRRHHRYRQSRRALRSGAQPDE